MSVSAVAIITARGGSKRIPRKNIRDFCGKPIIAYSIEAALKSGLFEDVIVSTDDEEIADIARSWGASVPFMRSAETSDDHSGTPDVLVEVIGALSGQGRVYDEACCIYPTAPFVTPKKLTESHELLSMRGVDSVMPVTAFSFPPQRGVFIRRDRMVPVNAAGMEKRSQDLESIYHDCGQFYWLKVDNFMSTHELLTTNTVPFLVSETEVQDIDNEDDWVLAEIKFKHMKDSYGKGI